MTPSSPQPASAANGAAARAPFYGWKLLGALWFVYLLNMGFPLYGGAVLCAAMLAHIPMDRTTYGLGFTLFNLFAGVPSIAVAASVRRWGARRTFLLGSALIFTGSLWMAFLASRPWHYLAGFGILIAAGIGFATVIPLATVVSCWFRRYRGRAMALALTASGVGGLAAAPLLNRLLEATAGNWRLGWILIALLALTSAALASLAVKESPQSLGQSVDGLPANAPAEPLPLATCYNWLPTQARRTRAFWILCLASVACQFPFFLFTAHWILHLRGIGIGSSTAALAMGLFTLGSIPGGLIGGWLVDRLPARFAFQLGLACYLLGSLLATQAAPGRLAVVFAAAILYGAAFRWSFVCLNTAIAHFFGPQSFPALSGSILTLSALLCSPAGFLGGRFFDHFGSYAPAFALNAAVALAGILALPFARIPTPPNH